MVFSYFLRFFLIFYLKPMEKRYVFPSFLFFGFFAFFFLSSAWAMEGEREEKRVLLSIDGGGYRGLIPAILLEDLEKSLSEIHGYDVSLSQHLDGLAGTSTGSIIAMGFAVSDRSYPSYPRHRASLFPTLYTENGKRIFSRVGWRSFWGIWGAKYDRTFLDNLLKTHFGEATLKNGVLQKEDGALVCTLVPAYRINPPPEPHYFCNFLEEVPDCRIREIVGASTAAPTYFLAKEVPEGSQQFYIDGGVFRNNPASALTLKMKSHFPNRGIVTISMGTGEEPKDFKKLRKAGKLKAAPGIIDLFMAASQQTVDEDMKDVDAQYIRIQPPLEEASLDKTDDATTEALKQAAGGVTAHEAYKQAKEVLSTVCAAKKKALRSAIETSVQGQGTEIRLENHPILSGLKLTELLFGKISDHASQLTVLTLKKCNIWNAENFTASKEDWRKKLTLQAVCKALQSCTNIRTVDLSQNRIGGGGLSPLVKASQTLPLLRTLILQENALPLSAYAEVKKFLSQDNSLTSLDLRNNPRLGRKSLGGRFGSDICLLLLFTDLSIEEENGEIRFFRPSLLTLMLNEEPVPEHACPSKKSPLPFVGAV